MILIAVIKNLFKDSLVYGVANVIQKLTPIVIIPIITAYLGKNALKIYDLSFVYTYLFTPLIVLGLESAASVFFFDEERTLFKKRQVLSYSFWMQVLSILIYGALFYSFRHQVAEVLFSNDNTLKEFWLLALAVTPGYVLLNYGLSILLWKRKKATYVAVCFLQTALTIGGVFATVLLWNGTIREVLLVVIGSITVCGLLCIYLERRDVLTNPFPLNVRLVQKLFLFGLPFGLTSFFRQLIPSIDRFFILKYNFDVDLPHYILAAKIASSVSMAGTAFVLAFTPYSLNKINQDDAESEISELFRLVSIVAFISIPVLLLFKDWIVHLFADASYAMAAQLFPFLFFGWMFDLFTYFTMLGIYKSKKSVLVLVILIFGTLVISLLNIFLVPVLGVHGAALSFCLTKASVFLITLVYLRKFFNIKIYPKSFIAFLMGSIALSYLAYILNFYWYAGLLFLFVGTAVLYIVKTSKERPTALVGHFNSATISRK